MFNQICINEELLRKYTFLKFHDPPVHKYNSILEYRRDLVKRQTPLCKNHNDTLNLEYTIHQYRRFSYKFVHSLEFYKHRYTHTHTHIYIYIYVCVCVCVWVYVCVYKCIREWAERWVDRKIHLMTTYLMMMTVFINGIQALQHRWKECVNRKGDNVKK